MADIIVTDGQGLPDKAYLSFRVGDVRRQMQFKPGTKFRFEGDSMPRHFIMDVFEKVGTAQVALADLARGVPGVDVEGSIEVLKTNGSSMNVSVKVVPPGGSTTALPASDMAKQPLVPLVPGLEGLGLADDLREAKKTIRHQAAMEAKNYLDGHAVQKLLQGMVHTLLEKQPKDPLDFMSAYLQEQRQEPLRISNAPCEAPLPNWSSQPGLGENEMPGFAIDGSQSLPDLSKHCSLVAEVLQEDAQLYAKLSKTRTPSGSTLAKCIKPGVDNRGNQLTRAMGIMAADEFCYDVFRDVFGPVVNRWHGEWLEEATQPVEIDALKVTDCCIEPGGGHVLSVQVCAVRNLQGIRFPTACSREERREVERRVSQALLALPQDLEGSYLPLRGSQSHAPRLGGMTEDEQRQLMEERVLFEYPECAVQLAAGLGRHWPDARGIFRSRSGAAGKGLSVQVNETDHIKIMSRRSDANLKQAFETFARAESCLRASLKESGKEFAQSPHFGFLSPDPAQIGTGMTLSAQLKVPLLSKNSDFKLLCDHFAMNAQVFAGADDRGTWEVSGSERLGSTEVEQVNLVIEGCKMLVDLEVQLEAGAEINVAELLASWQSEEQALGLGDDEYPGFPADVCPVTMPDLSLHHSSMAEVLKENPTIYARLRPLTTVNGVSLAKCIKTGVDNQGHPMIKTVGLVAGCADCYEVFREVFDPVIQKKYPAIKVAEVKHPTDMDCSKVSAQPMDATGDRVLAVRVRMSRNFSGIRMPPACSKDERRKVETIIVEALAAMDESGAVKGEYYPIMGSESHSVKPGGMSSEDEETLRKENLVFAEPDSEVQLSSGFGRHWPDARGVWVARDRRAVVRVNEDDHVRMVSTQNGQDLKEAFTRVCAMHKTIEDVARRSGLNFASSPRFGYLAVCPTNIGTCLIVSATLRIPRLSAQPEFRMICQKLNVFASKRAGLAKKDASLGLSEGVLDISNAEHLGSSEVAQVNAVIEGCRALLQFETRLDAGEVIVWDSELQPEPLGAKAIAPPMVVFGEIPGLGSDEYPGFPADTCPSVMPDLSQKFNLMADVLKNDSSIYTQLRGVVTQSGVTFAKCIKNGIDNAGHPMVKTVGAVAGDAECYDTFKALFDPLIEAVHKASKFAESGHKSDLDPSQVSSAVIDPSGSHAVGVRICGQRNFAGIRMLPACSRQERRECERMVYQALEELAGDFKGNYYPLQGSTTYAAKPTGMNDEELSKLDQDHFLFREADSALVLATGSGRDWPEARGVFRSHNDMLAAWVNEEDHLRLMSTAPGADLKAAFEHFCRAEATLRDKTRKAGYDFAWNSRLGYLSACPSNLGSGLRAEVTCKLPLLCQKPGFKAFCRRLRLQVRANIDHKHGVWDLLNSERLGPSEVEQVNTVVDGCRQLIDLETRLEKGEEVDLT